MNRWSRSPLLLWLIIAVLVVFAWLPGLHGAFVYDDKVEVIGNPTIRSLEHWRAVAGYNVSRLLVILTYAWDWRRYGLEPFGYHITNLALHLLGVGAALAMARAVGRLGGRGLGWLAVGLWALHPMATEAVTYITGRSELICHLFGFLSLWAWAEALLAEQDGRPGWRLRLGGLLAFVGAVGSKEVGMMVPFVALGLEAIVGARRVRWRWFLPWGVLVLGAALVRAQATGVWLPREVDRGLGVQLVTAAEVWLRYLGLWLLPIGQTIFHHVEDVDPLSLPGGLLVLGWLALAGLALWWGRRHRLAGWALLAGALYLLPSTSFVPLKEHMAEHRAYSFGLYLLLALAWSVPPRAERLGALLGLLLAPTLIMATRARNQVWSTEVGLWTEATERRPDVAEAWYGLGDAYRFAGENEPAIEAFEHATSLDPSLLDAWNNLGIARAQAGDSEGAREAWRKALLQDPAYCKAHNNLGSLAYRRQQTELALTELNSALSWCPDDVVAHYLLGNLYYGPLADWQKAQIHYEAVVALDPRFSQIDEVRRRLLEITW